MNPPPSKRCQPDSGAKILVLGLGNPILTDDGIGIHIVRNVASRCRRNDLAFVEASLGGLRLLDLMAGYDQAIIVDAIQTPDGRPGQIYRLHTSDLQRSLHLGSSHDLSLSSALALGRALGTGLPCDDAIVLIAVEVEDILTVGEICTPAVTSAIPRAVEAVLAELRALS